MATPTANELHEARRPLASLLSKSEKALHKLTPGTWQHAMLCSNVKALRLALALIDDTSPAAHNFPQTAMQDAVRAIASMATKAHTAQSKFPPGTPQHTLQRNRLSALQVAESLLSAKLRSRGASKRPHPLSQEQQV